MPPRRHLWALSLIVSLACRGGGGDPGSKPAADSATSLSPSARPRIVRELEADLAAPRHPADGGGRAWLEDAESPVRAGTPGRWKVVYEAGPLGIAEGGMIFLQPSPFWGWATPQVEEAAAPGFTRVYTDAEGVELEAQTAAPQLLAITVRGRALSRGERVQIAYGAGPAGAMADRFAERRERLWLAVDGDGDGVRRLLTDSPTLDVTPGAAARLVATLPSTARPGETVRLTLAVLDAAGNAGVGVEGRVRVAVAEGDPEGLELPLAIDLTAVERGCRSVELTVHRPGVVRLRLEGPGALGTETNPLWVAEDAPRLFWADLHGHSQLSDGTGTPGDYLAYARDVAALDIAALTDHDHWGLRFLDATPELWREIRDTTERFHQRGRFVTLLGYEWTSWLYGHRHVLYFTREGEVVSSLDPEHDTPAELWQALAGKPALTFAHHSAGGPVATDWSFPPPPELEPVTEVVSVHGSSEAWDSPRRIYSPVQGNFVRDALDRGYRLGFVGSGDSHDGHPGLAHLVSGVGGVAALQAEELTREAVLAALRARRVYATSGPRILLRVRLDEHPMGAVVPAGQAGELDVSVLATAPLERVDVVRSGKVAATIPGRGRRELAFGHAVEGVAAGEYLYVRVVQSDGGLAWSSPIFFTG